MTAESKEDRHWSLDRKVPLALIVSICILVVGQTGVVSWTLSNASTRLDALERKMVEQAPQAERIIRLEEKVIRTEEKVGAVQQGVNEIKTILARPR